MKKKLSIIIIAVIIIGIGATFIMRSGGTPEFIIDDILAPTAAADYYAEENRLKVEKGTASILRADGEEEVVEIETTVGIGDTILISAGGEATLYWFDDSISRLSGGTEITIDKADYNPENINETDIGFEVVTGEVWSKVQNLVDEDSEFLSYSGNIVAGVRGSTYNFTVKNGMIEVDSIRHAAFIGERSGTEIDFAKTIISGRQALIDQSKKFKSLDQIMEVKNIGEERLQDLQENIRKDKKDERVINEKRTDRLKKKVGPLPGEPYYDKKMKLINKKLESITDPTEKAELEVRIAQMQIQETMAQITTKGKVIAFISQIKRARQLIEESGLSGDTKEQMFKELKQHIAIADRFLDITPGQQDLYELKDALRNMRMEWEENPDKREWLEGRLIEMRLYELRDWTKYNGFDPEQFEALAERYFIGMERMQEFFKDNPEFQDLAEGLMSELEGRPIDLDMLKDLRDQFQLTEEEIQVIKQVIENVPKIPLPADTIELLDVQPLPTLEIIENAPYHQGESPM